MAEIVAPRSAISSSSSGPRPGAMREREARAEQPDLVEIADDAAADRLRPPTGAGSASPADACARAGRCVPTLRQSRASSSGVHHCTPCGPYCTSNVALPAAAATASTSASLLGRRHGCADEALPDFIAGRRRQGGKDRLRRPVDQRIAVAHRDRKADAHADIARGARHLGNFGRQVGQPLHAGVVHHHHAGAAERAARQRHGAREIGIDRRQKREIVQPDFERLAGRAERA